MSRTATWRSHVTGPRFARFDRAVRNRVWADPELTLVACEEDRGLLRSTTRFEVEGPESAVLGFQRDILAAIEQFNG